MSGSSGVTGAILAGGAASRFGGRPKGLELVGGVRIIDRVIAALAPNVDEVLLVSSLPEAASWVPGVRVVSDRFEARASLVGIDAAIAAAGGPVVVVAWDMPGVTAALIAALIARREPGIDAVVPLTESGAEPCCALYEASCGIIAERRVRAGELSLRRFVAAIPTVRWLEGEELAALGEPSRLFGNVNTPGDLGTT